MFPRRNPSSPLKFPRELRVDTTRNPTSPYTSPLGSRPLTTTIKFDQNSEIEEPKAAVTFKLDQYLVKLRELTTKYLTHIKKVAEEIILNWPYSDLKNISVSPPEEKTAQAVFLRVNPSGQQVLFIECKKLQDNIRDVLNNSPAGNKGQTWSETWFNVLDKQMALKKLHHTTIVFSLLNIDQMMPTPLHRIVAVKNYLERFEVRQELRFPRLEDTFPGDTCGGVYLKDMIHILYDAGMVIDNLFVYNNPIALNKSVLLRLEWQCLNFLNELADIILPNLCKQKLTTLRVLQAKCTAADDKRFFEVKHQDLDENEPPCRIHISALIDEENQHLLSSDMHIHLKRLRAILRLLEFVEEMPNVSAGDESKLKAVQAEKLRNFTDAIGVAKNNFMNNSVFFWQPKTMDPTAQKFFDDVRTIQVWYSSKLEAFSPTSVETYRATSPSQ